MFDNALEEGKYNMWWTKTYKETRLINKQWMFPWNHYCEERFIALLPGIIMVKKDWPVQDLTTSKSYVPPGVNKQSF
jgi:hypothetical protein